MKLRVSYAKRRYKDKVYVTPLLVTSYRDESGVPRNKTVLNLSDLPAHAIAALEEALQYGDPPKFDVGSMKYQFSANFGDCMAVMRLMKKLGVTSSLECLTAAQQDMVAVMIWNLVCHSNPMVFDKLVRRWNQTAWPVLLGRSVAPRLEFWYGALKELGAKKENIDNALYDHHRNRNRARTLYLHQVVPQGGGGKLVVALATDDSPRPLSVRVFSGSAEELEPSLASYVSQFDLPSMLVLGDGTAHAAAAVGRSARDPSSAGGGDFPRGQGHPVDHLPDASSGGAAVKTEGEVCCHVPDGDGSVRSGPYTAAERRLREAEQGLAELGAQVSDGRLEGTEAIRRRLAEWNNRWCAEPWCSVQVGDGKFSYTRREGCPCDGFDGQGPKPAASLQDCWECAAVTRLIDRHFRSVCFDEASLAQDTDLQRVVRGYGVLCSLALFVSREAEVRLRRLFTSCPDPLKSYMEIWDELSRFTLGWFRYGGSLRCQLGDCSVGQRKLLSCLGIQLNRREWEKLAAATEGR